MMRRNLLKNVVMRIVEEIRERKKRPGLGEVLEVYRVQKSQDAGPETKLKFQEKFIKLYSSEKDQEEED